MMTYVFFLSPHPFSECNYGHTDFYSFSVLQLPDAQTILNFARRSPFGLVPLFGHSTVSL